MMARNADISHINERRLRPIYDCLDNGNNKKALQEAEKVLKKQKGFSCAKVLKALALLRMGRQEESVSILRDVHNEAPTDDSTLQAMTICYRELHKIELIADVYELATKKEPTNEELHSHLFMAYVRMSEYKKQQLAAMTLYKLKPKNPYYFWAVMSIYMQAICAKDKNIAQKIHLPLAEKMCRKFYDEGKIEAEAEVELYLMVLEKQHNYNEMLKIIDSSVGEKLNNYLDFLSRRKAEILKFVARHKDAHNAFTNLIENNVDQLEYYIELYNISITLDEQLDSANESVNDGKHQSYHSYQYLSSLIEFIDKRVDKTSRDKLAKNFHIKSLQRQRGPYLAKMLIYELIKKRVQTQGDIQHLLISISSSLTDLLIDYYKEFGSKQACIYDIYYILEKSDIESEEIDIFLLQVKQLLLSLSDNDKDLNEMQKHVCYYYLAHYTGQHDGLTNEERADIVQYLLKQYLCCYDNMVVNYDFTETEPQPTDQYIILIPYILLVAKNELEDSLVFQLLVIMEWALAKSPSNFYFKIQIMKLYNSIGAVSSSHVLIDSLDIKHIQYDSLGYLFLPPLITCGHLSAAEQFISNALKFYSANSKDTLDYLISCYKYGSFTKVDEIIKLRDKLNNSIQYCSVAIERMTLDLILETKNHSMTENIINCMEIDPEFDRFVWNELCDNRDYSVLRCNHLITEKTLEKKKQQSFDDELVWLKMRHLQIRAIAAAHYLVSSNLAKNELLVNKYNNNESDTNGTENNRNISEILSYCEYVSSLESMRSTFLQSTLPLEGPQPSRISHYCKRNYSKVISSLFQFILALNNEPKQTNSELSDIKSGDIFVSIITEIESTIKESSNSLISLRNVFEQLTNCIETLSIAVILLGISQSIMKHNMNISNKKTKKKKDNRDLSENYEFIVKIYMSLVNKFEQSATLIEAIIKSIDYLTLISSQTYYLAQLSDIDSYVTRAKEKMQLSFAQSIKELEELLLNKSKYLQTLKF